MTAAKFSQIIRPDPTNTLYGSLPLADSNIDPNAKYPIKTGAIIRNSGQNLYRIV
jgi:hypothetical protein